MTTATYPEAPGHKEPTTSRQAALAIEQDAPRLRRQVLRCLRVFGPHTADEIAGILALSVLSVRPRVTECRALGYIEPTGQRRRNGSGRAAHVWRLKP